MKTKYKIALFFIFLFGTSSPAWSQCESIRKAPYVQVNIDYEKIFYDNKKSHKEFPANQSDDARGLTRCELKSSLNITPYVRQVGKGKHCVGIDKLVVDIGFPRIDIYIDKKYKPGSCNYTVVKTHENYHARVQQEGLRFFSNKIKRAFQIAAEGIKPTPVTTQEQVTQVTKDMMDKILKSTQPTISYVSEQLKEKNAAIDTKESYFSESQKCPTW